MWFTLQIIAVGIKTHCQSRPILIYFRSVTQSTKCVLRKVKLFNILMDSLSKLDFVLAFASQTLHLLMSRLLP